MFSLGAEPYAAIPIKQLKSFLNSGQRLDKPQYADANMYAAFFSDFEENNASFMHTYCIINDDDI
jgi:hypothetical protein